MSWPLASHFSAMLQNPRVAFRDPRLQQCRIEKDEQNQPRPWAGAFAVVYKARRSSTAASRFAVRVFTTESPERRERYDLISEYLKTRRLRCLVDFEYRDRSIRSAGDGKWYPLILMDWVQGETLFKWVRARCLEGDGAALAAVADRWVEVVKELGRRADRPRRSAARQRDDHRRGRGQTGRLRLHVRAGAGRPAEPGGRRRALPAPQPQRRTRCSSLDLDHFSALVIYVALRALAVDPQLVAAIRRAAGLRQAAVPPRGLSRSPSNRRCTAT